MPVTITREVGRPSAVEEALAAWAVGLSELLEGEQIAKGFIARGEALNHLVVITKPNEVEFLTVPYLRFNIVGRGPGGFPPLNAIEDWIKIKNIRPDGITVKSLAYLIGRKMAADGDQVHRGEREGVDMQGAVEASFDEVMGEEANKIAIEAANEMLSKFQKIK